MPMVEVSGYAGTFLEAIEQEVLPQPPLMEWNEFEVWRRTAGRRPTAKDDGSSTTSAEESKMWNEVMTKYYGADFKEVLKERREKKSASVGSEGSGVSSKAAPGSQGVSAPPGVGAADDAESRASEVDTRSEPLTEESVLAGGGPPMSPSRPSTPVSTRTEPESPGTLTKRVTSLEFDPATQRVEDYLERVSQLCSRLSDLGCTPDVGFLESKRIVAQLHADAYREAQMSTAEGSMEEKTLRILRREFGTVLADSLSGGAQPVGSAISKKLAALEALLGRLGFDWATVKNRALMGDPDPAKATPSPMADAPGPQGMSASPRVGATPQDVTPKGGSPVAALHTSPVPVPPVVHVPPSLQAQLSPPGSAGQGNVMENLLRRLSQVEAVQGMAVATGDSRAPAAAAPASGNVAADSIAALTTLVAEQTKLMTASQEMMVKSQALKDRPKSTIRIEPKVTFPHLGDENMGGREAEEFFEKFEDMMGLANDGQGMNPTEKLVTLKGCVHGSRRVIYDNLVRSHRRDGKMESDPEDVYEEIKGRLLQFKESTMERQMRVKKEWESLYKDQHSTASQFEAKWEKQLADLAEAGLAKSANDLLIDYLVKIGSKLSEEVRRDRRPRPDGAGGYTTRTPESWAEAHAVVAELEGIRSGTRAIASGGTVTGTEKTGKGDPHASGGAKGKGKGKKGEDKKLCFKWRDDGRCELKEKGTCPYAHPMNMKGVGKGAATEVGGQAAPERTRKPTKAEKKAAAAAAAGRGAESQGFQQKNQKHIMCPKVLQGIPCPLRGQCPYEHDRVRFEANKRKAQAAMAYKGKGKGKGWKGKGKGKKGKGKGKKGKGKGKKGKGKGKGQQSGGQSVEAGQSEEPAASTWYQDEEGWYYEVWMQDGEEWYQYDQSPESWGYYSGGQASWPTWEEPGWDAQEWTEDSWSNEQWTVVPEQDASQMAEEWGVPIGFFKAGAVVLGDSRPSFSQTIHVKELGAHRAAGQATSRATNSSLYRSPVPGFMPVAKPLEGSAQGSQGVSAPPGASASLPAGESEWALVQAYQEQGKQEVKFKPLRSLSELPAKVWTPKENEPPGTQFFTRVLIGQRLFPIMMDGGSAVNSIPEAAVLDILNDMKKDNIKMGDEKHPIIRLEKWKEKEKIRGVAAGAEVELLGGVVVRIHFIEHGKQEMTPVMARFKITKLGSTDWAPIILGAKAIDCTERNGLGFLPGPHCHRLTGLGMMVERLEDPYPHLTEGIYQISGETRRFTCYAIRTSVFDDEDALDNGGYGVFDSEYSRAAEEAFTLTVGQEVLRTRTGAAADLEEF